MNHFVWGLPMLLLLFGTHIFFTFRLKFVQKHVFHGIRLSVAPEDKQTGAKGMSSYSALMTTLAATLGTGNIVGISTAVAYGGPGSIFWCWLTGLLGMATSYAECYLCHRFRQKLADGTQTGGTMYILSHVLHHRILSIFYAICIILASFLIGCTTQSNSIALTAQTTFHIPREISGLFCCLLIGLVLMGGLKAIGSLCSLLVPVMALFYIGSCILVLIINKEQVIPSMILILQSAFSKQAVTGGLTGGGLLLALRYGIARGLYTNEAGLGSAGIAAASAYTDDSRRQALISMTGVFWDTVVMCGITGIVIVCNMLGRPSSIVGCSAAELTTAAFSVLPMGSELLSISLILFAVSTTIGWSFLGEQAIHFLFGSFYIPHYKSLYLILFFVGALLSLEIVWELTDFINLFLFLSNVYAILRLSGRVPCITKTKRTASLSTFRS